MQKVLVTGASGFIGSNVADELSERGYKVILFDVRESRYKRDDQTMIAGDILDLDQLIKITEGVDYVFHFAGIADIGDCANHPIDTVKCNVLGSVNLLEACRINKVKRFIFASSAYVFSDYGSFYRSSKRACESFVADYYERYGLEFTILRYGSLYGDRSDGKNGLFRLLEGILFNDKFEYEGTGNELREFIHVKDAAIMTADSLEETYRNKYFIITGLERLRTKELIELIKEISGRDTAIVYKGQTAMNHYVVSPYNAKLEEARKIISNTYVDIGQGIVKMIYDIRHAKS
ncbi:MAG: NAD(P)-dependent oxidoreductase [Helicobacteraceae bacterium]|nr:NAD(P)-dependent oxidoreductase [Helicobacteraceae bacterium]